ncbi:MAG: hypothetical protein JSS66_17710 [Armatimonadetes bacterium]|nr:hypothetical protein [Armatimonadota bacterium]
MKLGRTSAFLLAVGLSYFAQAQGYYTVDVVHQWLCKVNVNTGAITYVGAANNWGEPQYSYGYNAATSTYLCFNQGHLCALTSWRIGWPRKIAFVACYGPNAGKQIGGYYVNVPYLSGNAKIGGMDSLGNDIIITWAGTSDQGAGRIGSAYNLNSYGQLGPADSDCYMYADGQSWAIDLKGDSYDLYADPLAPLSYQGSDALVHAGNPADLADYSPSEMVAMSDTGNSIVHISKYGGWRISIVPLTGAWQGAAFQGLAYAPPPIWIPNNQIQ